MTSRHVSFRRLDPELPPPTPAHPGDAGYDLYAAEDFFLQPGARASIPTGLAIAVPEGFAALVLPRSGHAARHGVGLVNAPGLVDAGYRGEIRVLLVNHGREPVAFARGERIAQLVVVEVPALVWGEVDELPPSTRGEGGFGSTGR
jgi:dUTP pyrophosphatase